MVGAKADVHSLLGALAAGVVEVAAPVQAVPVGDEAAPDSSRVERLARLRDQVLHCALFVP